MAFIGRIHILQVKVNPKMRLLILFAVAIQGMASQMNRTAGAVAGFVITTGILLWGLLLYSMGSGMMLVGFPLNLPLFLMACAVWYFINIQMLLKARTAARMAAAKAAQPQNTRNVPAYKAENVRWVYQGPHQPPTPATPQPASLRPLPPHALPAQPAIGMNGVKTTLLLAAMTVLLIALGDQLRGADGAVVAFLVAACINFFGYFYSDEITLKMHGAQAIESRDYSRLFQLVQRLAARANLPMPRLYLIPSDSPNAFATGRNPENAAIAVTRGLLNLLSEDELEGVLAHELAHVRNRDILTGSIAATLAGTVFFISRHSRLLGGRRQNGMAALLMALLAPLAAILIQLWVSRTREYQADATGAEICGNPAALASALGKLNESSQQIPLTASPASAHMFIVKPAMSGLSFRSLFSTHPPIEKRIERLMRRCEIASNASPIRAF